MTNEDTEQNKENQTEEETKQDDTSRFIDTKNPPESIKPRKNSKWPLISISLVAILALLSLAYFGPLSNGQAVASVNGEEVTKDDLYQSMVDQVGQKTLDQLITDKLIAQEAAKANIQVTAEDVKKKIDEVKASLPSEDQFDLMLQQYGMTEEDLKAQLKSQLLIEKLLEPKIEITEKDMKAFFKKNKVNYSTPEQVRASHILVKEKSEAQKILEDIQNGADFAKLAKEKSQDPGSKNKGGDLGYFSRGKMVPAFENAAFNLNEGDLSDLVKTENGYHIIKVVDKKPAEEATFEGNKEEIRKQLFNTELRKKAPEWMKKLKDEAEIENYLKKEKNKEG